MEVAQDDHFTACPDSRTLGGRWCALVRLVAVQGSVVGLYRPPVLNPPPQIIISLPVHTAA